LGVWYNDIDNAKIERKGAIIVKVVYGKGTTEYGPGVSIELSGEEVALAISAFLTGSRCNVFGPRTITVNKELCKEGSVYVDPSGFVIYQGEKFDGRGPKNMVPFCEVKIRTCKICREKGICRGIEGGWICQRCVT
jgi:hypothetical protein